MILMFVLTLTDGLFCTWFIYRILSWCWYLEIGTSSIDCAQLSRFHLKMGQNSVSKTLYALNKNRTMDKVQKHNNRINLLVYLTLSILQVYMYII
jgi:hypothetical protein